MMMKRIKTGLLLMLLLLGMKTSAQGNLQFNQVINLNLSGVINTGLIGNLLIQTLNVTVPANKVWKIEGATTRINSSSSSPIFGLSTANKSYIFLDNNLIGFINQGTSVLVTSVSMPFWISSGSHTVQLVADISSSGSLQQIYGMISALEFNVLP
jgi:hypothetical protein